MSSQKYLIPIAAIMALGTTGCEDPVIGDWDIVELSDLQLPYTYSIDYFGISYEAKITSEGLEIDANMGGALRVGFSAELNYDGYTYSYSYTFNYDVSVETVKKRSEYTIELSDYDGDHLDLDCTMSDKVLLECIDDDGYDWEFEKQ